MVCPRWFDGIDPVHNQLDKSHIYVRSSCCVKWGGGGGRGINPSYHIPNHHPPTILLWQRRGKAARAGTNHMGGEAKKKYQELRDGPLLFSPLFWFLFVR